MKPKELKNLIFGKSKPKIRKLSVMDGGAYSRDMAVLWAAYKAGSFNMPEGLTQDEFAIEAEKTIGAFHDSMIVEDASKAYQAGFGPIGMTLSNSAGMIVEPKFMFFKWASCRNILRACVAVLSMIRASSKTGIVIVRVNDLNRKMADHLRKYDLLFFMGKSDDNEYLYSVKGRGSNL